MINYKTTKKDFAEFKKEAEYWIDYFGLKNWDWNFTHQIQSDNARAEYWVNIDGRICSIGLSEEWNYIPEKNDIKQSAFHEVCEIMIAPLSTLCSKIFNHDFVEGKTHDIIRRLENTIFKEKRG